MSSTSRPIPISNGRGGSQRSSPGSDLVSPNGALMTQSLPADVHHARFMMAAGSSAGSSASRFQPPRAPSFGSLPAPSFLEDLPMEELSLPPPSLMAPEERSFRPASVIQFASSCPSDMGYLRQAIPLRTTWAHPVDDFDLSKSPALAAMSTLRGRMGRPSFGASTDYSMHTVNEEMMEHLTLDEDSQDEEELERQAQQEQFQRRPDRRGSYDGGIFDLED